MDGLNTTAAPHAYIYIYIRHCAFWHLLGQSVDFADIIFTRLWLNAQRGRVWLAPGAAGLRVLRPVCDYIVMALIATLPIWPVGSVFRIAIRNKPLHA